MAPDGNLWSCGSNKARAWVCTIIEERHGWLPPTALPAGPNKLSVRSEPLYTFSVGFWASLRYERETARFDVPDNSCTSTSTQQPLLHPLRPKKEATTFQGESNIGWKKENENSRQLFRICKSGNRWESRSTDLNKKMNKFVCMKLLRLPPINNHST